MTGGDRTFTALLVVAVLSAALFWLLREHWGHVAGYLPYLLLLACPLMHLFHGHGGHDHGRMSKLRGPPPDDALERASTRRP
jgi:hypothetical protein